MSTYEQIPGDTDHGASDEGGNERSIICLRCPRGCEISTTLDGYGGIVEIFGNVCKLGRDYVEAEIADPRRILPTSVRVRGGDRPLVPVWTPKPIPKGRLLDLARATRGIELEAPVTVGQVVIENWEDLGVDLVTSGAVRRV